MKEFDEINVALSLYESSGQGQNRTADTRIFSALALIPWSPLPALIDYTSDGGRTTRCRPRQLVRSRFDHYPAPLGPNLTIPLANATRS